MSTSFSSAARTEICRELPHSHCCALAECFGILLFCNSFQDNGIKIITESREFACILPKLFKKAFDLDFDSYPSLASSGKLVFLIREKEKLAKAKQYKHMTFYEAADMAKRAEVSELWLTHFSPSLVHGESYMPQVRDIFPNAYLGKDGKTVELMFQED